MPAFQTLVMNDVVIHSIPSIKRAERDGAVGPELSDLPVTLSSKGRRYLTERLVAALLKARQIRENEPSSSPAPQLIRDAHADPATELVPQSGAMAEHLFSVENGRNSAGLIMVVAGTIDGDSWIVVSKIEHEQGVQVKVDVDAKGIRTFSLNYLDDLIFAETTKVYKIAAFPAATSVAAQPLAGYAADPQNGRVISDVWLHRFLGCEYVERPDVLTERFYEGISKAVSRVAALSPVAAANVEIALLAEMNKTSSTIYPGQFIAQNVPPEHQDAFAAELLGHGAILQAIPKDTSNITSRILRIKIDTERDATVLVPPSMFNDGTVEITESELGQSRVTVRDKVRNISGTNGSAGHRTPQPANTDQPGPTSTTRS